jgi:drug/metabolite transporter (DMT)-like permease
VRTSISAEPRTLLATAFALAAFAANSILCRLALAPNSAGADRIDPATFTSIRLVSGAIVLALIVALHARRKANEAGDWVSGAMLFLYAVAFSFAYLGLTAGTGALILFGSVQATMLGVTIVGKQRPSPRQWIGLALAVGGLVYLLAPGLSAPPLDRALLMTVAGVAWGVYSLRGRTVSEPVLATAGNFLRAAPFALIVSVAFFASTKVTAHGALLALTSGAITSGLGYVIWYTALPALGATRAAIVQLLVPVLAAVGGVVLLSETLTERLVIAAAVTLSGVAFAMFRPARQPEPAKT